MTKKPSNGDTEEPTAIDSTGGLDDDPLGYYRTNAVARARRWTEEAAAKAREEALTEAATRLEARKEAREEERHNESIAMFRSLGETLATLRPAEAPDPSEEFERISVKEAATMLGYKNEKGLYPHLKKGRIPGASRLGLSWVIDRATFIDGLKNGSMSGLGNHDTTKMRKGGGRRW